VWACSLIRVLGITKLASVIAALTTAIVFLRLNTKAQVTINYIRTRSRTRIQIKGTKNRIYSKGNYII